jgi:antitoxin Phd
MKTTWKLQEARSQFSKLVEEALTHGPQYVTRRGVDTVVIVSVKEYESLTSKKPDFTDFLLSCPTLDAPLDLERQRDYPRNLSL